MPAAAWKKSLRAWVSITYLKVISRFLNFSDIPFAGLSNSNHDLEQKANFHKAWMNFFHFILYWSQELIKKNWGWKSKNSQPQLKIYWFLQKV